MPTRQQLEDALIAADAAGDVDGATIIAEEIKAGRYDGAAQQPSMLEYTPAAAVGETAAALGSGAIAAPISGLAGLVELARTGGDNEAAAAAVRGMQERLTYQPRTAGGRAMTAGVGGALEPVGQVFQEVGKVAGAEGERLARNVGAEPGGAGAGVGYAVGTAAPEAILAAVGGAPARVARPAPVRVPIATSPDAAAGGAQILQAAAETPSGTFRQAPREAAIQNLAQEVQPRQDVLAAGRELGMAPEDIPPEVMSGSPAFRAAAGGARSVMTPEGMALQSEFVGFANRVAERAADAAKRADAEDYAGFNVRVTNELKDDIERIKATESQVYDDVAESARQVAGTQAMDIAPAVQFVNERLAGVANDLAQLDPAARAVGELFGRFSKNQDGTVSFVPKPNVTWQGLDNFRRQANADVGAGVFENMDSANKKLIAGVVSSTQKANAEALGFGRQFNNALELSKARFAAQNAEQVLLGKNLDKSLATALDSAATNIARKGGVAEFEKVMQNLPQQERKRAMAAYTFNKMFRQGEMATEGGVGRFDAAKFGEWFNQLSASPTAKATVYKYMTPEMRRDVEALGKMASAIRQASQDTVTTGRSATAAANFGNASGMVGRILGRMAIRTASRIEPTGAAQEVVGAAQTGKRMTDAAAAVMASPEFRVHVTNVAKGADEAAMRASESAMRDSQAWKRFNAALPAEQRRRIATTGIAAWLASEDEQ